MSTSPHDYQQKVAIIRLHIGGETGSLIQAIFMKSRIFPYRDYERPVVIGIQYISCLCVLKGILSGTPITKKFVRLQ